MTGHLDSYQIYKTCLVPWLNEMPDHWAADRLKTHVASIANPASGPEHDEPYIGLEHVESWTGKIRAEETTVDFDSQAKRFCPGDVLFGKLRPYLAKVARPERDGVCVGEFLVLRCQDQYFIPSYLEHLMRSKPIIDAIDASTFGAKMPRANWDFIGNLRLPIPPLTEQAVIVRYLDDADQRIRAYVSAKERLIALLEEERQAVIQRAVTRGLDPNVKLKSSRVEWLGDMPEHWEVGRLKAVSEIRYGLGQPPRESATGLPLIRATNVSRGHIAEKDLLRVDPADVPVGRDAFLREKEIIVVRSGAYTADSAIIPREYTGSVTGYDMVVNVTGAIPEFIAAALLSKYLRDDQLIVASNRAAQPHLNAEELGAAFILLPPLPEQGSIVQHLERVNTDIDTGVSLARRQIELMEEYRTRLIAEVVTGKLDVREAKP
jgi:type I restriction enzyme S subunit